MLKCLQPKKPLYEDSGLGCGAFRSKCFGLSTFDAFFCAGAPHKRYTIGLSCSLRTLITASVNFSQPMLLCEFASCARTVRTVFSIRMPCFAHFSRYPLDGISQPMSSCISLYIFTKDGGMAIPGFTEKQRPCA